MAVVSPPEGKRCRATWGTRALAEGPPRPFPPWLVRCFGAFGMTTDNFFCRRLFKVYFSQTHELAIVALLDFLEL